jgi:membrane protease YdiL (CAAX protease family)
MDHATLDEAPVGWPDAPRPFGPLGLLFSLAGIAAISLVALAAGAGLVVLGDVLLFGWAHWRDAFNAGMDMVRSGRRGDQASAALLVGSAVYLAAILGTWAMARLRAGKGWRRLLGWTPFAIDRTFWGLLLASVIYQLGASFLIAYIHPQAKDWVSIPDSPAGLAMACLMIVVLAPLAEELLFRGWIYTALRWRFGFAPALLTTAALFALAHWESTHLYALAILPIALVLGYLRERTGSARATTLFHMIYNFCGLALSFLGKV